MASYNKVLLMGNLTRDVDLRQIGNGQSVANIGIAVNRRYKTSAGEERDETTFVDCEAWGRTAEVTQQYLSKGRPVFIEGRLKLDTWKDSNTGENRSKHMVVVESFQFIDSKSGDGGNNASNSSSQGGPSREHGGSAPGYGEPISADEIPF